MNALSAEALQKAATFISPLGLRQLSLRWKKLDDLNLEQLAKEGFLTDSFEAIDATGNPLLRLRPLPPLRLLRSLYLCHCNLERIESNAFADSPALEVVNISDNRVSSLSDLRAFGALRRLRTLTAVRNPVCAAQAYRRAALAICGAAAVVKGKSYEVDVAQRRGADASSSSSSATADERNAKRARNGPESSGQVAALPAVLPLFTATFKFLDLAKVSLDDRLEASRVTAAELDTLAPMRRAEVKHVRDALSVEERHALAGIIEGMAEDGDQEGLDRVRGLRTNKDIAGLKALIQTPPVRAAEAPAAAAAPLAGTVAEAEELD